MNQDVLDLWPELEWIVDPDLRQKTARTWELALKRSVLSVADLEKIPFTLLVPDLNVSFMTHKRSVVHIARDCGMQMNKFFKENVLLEQEMLVDSEKGSVEQYAKSKNISISAFLRVKV